jgi:SAM-dependent methyltransferase
LVRRNLTISTWHYGLVARWWSEFNTSGPEIDFFQNVIEENGQPALDAGCGTGRLLIPYLNDGIDIDGCDASPDMLAHCAARAEALGFTPTLIPAQLHEFRAPRKYKTIVCCGAFGLSGSRRDDLEALKRLKRSIAPGGVLALDFYLPGSDPRGWNTWVADKPPAMPGPWSKPDRRRATDGTELELCIRRVAFDPLEQSYASEIRVEQFDGAQCRASETYTLHANIYFKNEIVWMLELAGFSDIKVQAAYENREPEPFKDHCVVFYAR